MMKITRRDSLKALAGLAAFPGAGTPTSAAAEPALHLSCNQYPWFTFYQRAGRDFEAELEHGLGELAESGCQGYEPGVGSPEQIARLEPLLKRYGLEMRSIYVNSTLHDRDTARSQIAHVLAIAEAARPLGTTLVVTNPTPLRWGGPENKTDAQIADQAQALDQLGAELRQRGVTLAYHNHDAELRNAAREFHHMMCGTDPAHVALCLDAHWVFRGAGDSQVALFDVVSLYADRIVELHLRQSEGGVWTEALGDGDIDYARLVAELRQRGRTPLVVLEQAVEAASPHTMSALEAHRRSVAYARHVCAPLAPG